MRLPSVMKTPKMMYIGNFDMRLVCAYVIRVSTLLLAAKYVVLNKPNDEQHCSNHQNKIEQIGCKVEQVTEKPRGNDDNRDIDECVFELHVPSLARRSSGEKSGTLRAITLMQTQKLLEQLVDAYDGDIARLKTDLDAFGVQKEPAKPAIDLSDKPIVVEIGNVSKTYKLGKTNVQALDDVSLKIHAGQMVALVGPSGSGKSTLLQLIGGLDKPTQGTVVVDGVDLHKMRDGVLSRYRGQKIGFVFQSFYLQPFLNVRDNIEIPAIFARTKRPVRHQKAREIASAVGLEDRLKHFGRELSGGQIQRTAIARALINQPKILLADEPTGNLDQTNAHAIFELFEKARTEFGTTVIVVTHDESLARKMDRSIRLGDGKVIA